MSKLKVVVFGMGYFFNEHFEEIFDEYSVVALCDNDADKHGIIVKGLKIAPPEVIKDITYDFVVISLSQETLEDEGLNDIIKQFEDLGVPKQKLKTISINGNTLLKLGDC